MKNRLDYVIINNIDSDVVKSVDTTVYQTVAPLGACGFESRHRGLLIRVLVGGLNFYERKKRNRFR